MTSEKISGRKNFFEAKHEQGIYEKQKCPVVARKGPASAWEGALMEGLCLGASKRTTPSQIVEPS